MNITLHVCSARKPISLTEYSSASGCCECGKCKIRYYADIAFKLSKWCSVLHAITPKVTKSLEGAQVWINWSVNDNNPRCCAEIDTDCTWLVDASVFQPLKFHEDDWHQNQIIYSNAVSAFLSKLPPDWPIIVRYL